MFGPDEPTRDASVLLVEDEDFVREAATEILELAGYHVTAAKDASEALQLLELAQSFDLLCTDLVLPGMDGAELAQRFAETCPNGSVLLMSGHSQVSAKDHSLVGIRLRKPFSSEELLRSVRETLHAKLAPSQ